MRTFKEFKDQGWIKEKTPDEARARSVIEEAEHRLKFFKDMKINESSTNYIIENMYDVIRELIEAKMLIDGYKTYSHEAIVSYLKVLEFQDSEIKFVDTLRETRHKTKYYGLITDIEYADKVVSFTKEIYKKLKTLLEEDTS